MRAPEAATAIATLVLFVAPAGIARGDNTREEHPCLGVWQGLGQNGWGLPWAIEMTVASTGPRCGGIEYDSPELDCGGPFVRCELERTSGQAIETYTHNAGCSPPGEIDFRCEGDLMQWEWRGTETVQAELRRVRRITPLAGEAEPRPPHAAEPEPPHDRQEPAPRLDEAGPTDPSSPDTTARSTKNASESPADHVPDVPANDAWASSCACSAGRDAPAEPLLFVLVALVASLRVRRLRR
jgi:MYXO-CTERM domain-containing protein